MFNWMCGVQVVANILLYVDLLGLEEREKRKVRVLILTVHTDNAHCCMLGMLYIFVYKN